MMRFPLVRAKRYQELQKRTDKLEKENRSLERVKEALEKEGEPKDRVIKYAEIGKCLAEDGRYLDYETHPLMRLISTTSRSWCDRQLMDGLNLGLLPQEPQEEKPFPREKEWLESEPYRQSDFSSRLYGCEHDLLFPPRQSILFDKSLFHEFPDEKYDELCTCDAFPLASASYDTVELGVDAVYCKPWCYKRLFENIEKCDPSGAEKEWHPYASSEFIMYLPFCFTKVITAGNHTTATGILLHTGKVKPGRALNYSMSPIFDKVSTDGGTWKFDGKPYCYVSDPLAAQIWELCRAIHNSPYPIRYRGVVVNQNLPKSDTVAN